MWDCHRDRTTSPGLDQAWKEREKDTQKRILRKDKTGKVVFRVMSGRSEAAVCAWEVDLIHCHGAASSLVPHLK